MAKSTWTNGALALAVVPWIASWACVSEKDAPLDDPTEQEVRAVSNTSPHRFWFPVTGLLTDIATGNGPPSRWGIDTNGGPGGNRVVKWSGSQWAATSGRGVRIGLKGTDTNNDRIPDAFVPWVVNSDGHIFRANDATGNAWTQMPDLAPGVTAVDVGGGAPNLLNSTTMRMWAAGSDGLVYAFFENSNSWSSSALGSGPTSAIRVSGAACSASLADEVLALTSAGDVWAFTNGRWRTLGSTSDVFRTDVSAAKTFERSDTFLSSIMVTSGKAGEQVRTFASAFPFPRNEQLGVGDFVSTGPYVTAWPSVPIGGAPVAVSSDCDRNRVWIVTNTNKVYYGE